MADVDTRLRELTERAQELERKRMKRDADLDQAKAQMQDIVKRLKDEFEVTSLEEAQGLLMQLEGDLDQALAGLEAIL